MRLDIQFSRIGLRSGVLEQIETDIMDFLLML